MISSRIQELLHPFKELSEFTVTKLAIISIPTTAQIAGAFELFHTPWGYIWTLIILMVFDSISRVWRIIFRAECDFDAIKLLKGFVYKLGVYAWLVFPFTVYSNQFEPTSNYLLFGIYVALSTLELFSIARHWKIVGYLVAIAKQIRTGRIDSQELSELAEEYDILSRQKEAEEQAEDITELRKMAERYQKLKEREQDRNE